MKRISSSILALAAMVSVGLPLSQANAVTINGTLTVTASVASSCSVGSGTLAFGSYDTMSALATSGAATINVSCSLLTPFNVGLSAGAGGAVATRKMTNGANNLNYELTRPVLSGGGNWGNTVGTDTVSGIGTGLSLPFVITGSIPAQQSVANGSYSDTLTITLTY